jgi:hypothetical protein
MGEKGSRQSRRNGAFPLRSNVSLNEGNQLPYRGGAHPRRIHGAARTPHQPALVEMGVTSPGSFPLSDVEVAEAMFRQMFEGFGKRATLEEIDAMLLFLESACSPWCAEQLRELCDRTN